MRTPALITRLLTFSMLAAAIPASVAGANQAAAAAAVSTPEAARVVVDRYCVGCHSDRAKQGGLSLQSLDFSKPAVEAASLEKVLKKLRVGAMPPAGMPRPDAAMYASMIGWIEGQLDRAAAVHPNPGRTDSLHRLNRAEYQNAIRDLLDIEGLNFSTLLPGDDASYGFDNIAGALGISPTHLDQYLNAAREVSRYAVGDVSLPPSGETQITRPDLSQESAFEDMPFGTRGGARLRRYFPVDATYVVRFQAHSGVGRSEEEPNYIEVTVDGDRVFYERMAQKKIRHLGTGVDVQANSDWEIRVPIKAGLRDLAVTFVQTTNGQADELLQPFLRPPGISAFRLTRLGGYSGPYVAQLAFTGPFDVTGPGDTPARRRIFSCRPPSAAAEEPCARQILSTLAKRAYRRPATKEDVDVLVTFFKKGRTGGSFERGIQMALERLLASPDFLFRIERDPPSAVPAMASAPKIAVAATPYRVSDLELASRLSFFLWSSIPDEQLIDAASRGLLRNPAVLERQVRRMLLDPRSEALTKNFAGQWLKLRALPGIDRNTAMFPDFDDNLRQAMRRETELLFDSVVRENRSIFELLTADYTFVNERLARHYNIPNVYGSHFRRVPVTEPTRRGLLGHASILTITAQANRTSPVTRGKWILEELLGVPPPPPPANVPPLEQTELKGTLRQRMEEHRKNPVCSSCHKMMDPLGFALENFDPLGQWRDTDDGSRIDAAGLMLDGKKFEGITGLRAAILDRPEVFAETLTEKLLTYALGRGVEYYDMPAVRQIVHAAAKGDYRFMQLVLGVVKSAPFQMRLPASAAVASN
jgi:mono/diheme cytochrome c family protein